jgi:hypothetical protein
MAVHMGKKKMAKGDMMKEEKMMKREGRGMAKADMQKMMDKKKMMAKKGYHKMPDGKERLRTQRHQENARGGKMMKDSGSQRHEENG